MKIHSLLVAGSALCLMLGTASHAAFANDDMKNGMSHYHHHMMMGHDPFIMLDKNHDGFISKKEMLAHFNAMDSNHDGKISKQEMEDHMEKMRKDYEGMHGGWKHCEGMSKGDYGDLNR